MIRSRSVFVDRGARLARRTDRGRVYDGAPGGGARRPDGAPGRGGCSYLRHRQRAASVDRPVGAGLRRGDALRTAGGAVAAWTAAPRSAGAVASAADRLCGERPSVPGAQ
ncbi:hypothetical protein AB0I10_17815 [Streptomyces sp. NPDC050636]|uniref:hypothetical protein n=1 Tax=Streptomyces sp. NPDC050636 TaxID=3154510 RepID=UPI00342B5B8A